MKIDTVVYLTVNNHSLNSQAVSMLIAVSLIIVYACIACVNFDKIITISVAIGIVDGVQCSGRALTLLIIVML